MALGRSTVLASFCNRFTEAINTFRVYGFAPFMKDYLNTWMHSDEEITVISDDDESVRTNAIIRGIDCHTGMLQAEAANGEILSLYPDTHSLNLMDKLLYKKKWLVCYKQENEELLSPCEQGLRSSRCCG